MRAIDSEKLEMAYKYPFTSEAREILSNLEVRAIDKTILKMGRLRVEGAVKSGAIGFTLTSMEDTRLKLLMSYAYARLISSVLAKKFPIRKYAASEAARSSSAFLEEKESVMLRVCDELGVSAKPGKDGTFEISVFSFVGNAPDAEEMMLTNQNIGNGIVRMTRKELSYFIAGPMEKEIMRNLPIKEKEIPKEIIEEARQIKMETPAMKKNMPASAASEKTYAWVEKLLQTPIHDVRHRTVNIILAPYLINVRGMDAGAAEKVIIDYIERCKEINPATNVNESYIRYQCRYAKSKRLKPLSYEKAKELLSDVIDFGGVDA